jgi:hypothetical protein
VTARTDRISLWLAATLLVAPAICSAATRDQSEDAQQQAEAGKATQPADAKLQPVTSVPVKTPLAVVAPLAPASPGIRPTNPLALPPRYKAPAPASTGNASAVGPTLMLPFRTTTAALSAVGRGHDVAAAPPFTPIRVRTAAVGAIGRGPAPAIAPFPPVRVGTAPLGAVGRSTKG